MINDELISRKAVIDRLQKAQDVFLKESPLEACGISYAREIIASEVEIPTIEKRPQGEWILDWQEDLDFMSRKGWKCPFCKWRTTYGKSNFCMNCGADLRGEDHD